MKRSICEQNDGLGKNSPSFNIEGLDPPQMNLLKTCCFLEGNELPDGQALARSEASPASSIVSTPRSCAFASFDPGLSP